MTPAARIRHRLCGPPLAALLLLWAVVLLAAPRPALAGTPQEDLAQASRAYDRSDFDGVIRLLTPLLYPRTLFSDKEQALEAYRLLGLSHLFEKNRAEAEKQFLAILAQRPDYRLDPLVDPVAAVEFVEDVKRRNAEKIKQITERLQQDAERRRREAEAKRRQQEAEQKARCKPVRRTVVEHPFWINFVPFGAGQFQNGQRAKGYALLGVQAGLGALSLGTALGLRVAYPDGTVPPDQWERAQALSITQVVSGALFFAAVAYGVIDAVVYHQPRTVTTDPPQGGEQSGAATSWRLSPDVGPGGAGLGLSVTF